MALETLGDNSKIYTIVRVDKYNRPMKTIEVLEVDDIKTYNLEDIERYRYVDVLEEDYRSFYECYEIEDDFV